MNPAPLQAHPSRKAPLCARCKHFTIPQKRVLEGDFLCNHPSGAIGPIWGYPITRCHEARNGMTSTGRDSTHTFTIEHTPGICGVEGRLFEEKPQGRIPT